MLASIALAIAAIVPTSVWRSMPALCPSRWLGLPCPGCGIVRALSLLLHGHLLQAYDMNPRVVIVAPLLAGMSLRWALRTIVPASDESSQR